MQKLADPRLNTVVSGRRYYSPSQGRFLGRDSIEEDGGRNLYGFCANAPVDRWDILGLEWIEKKVASVWSVNGTGNRVQFGVDEDPNDQAAGDEHWELDGFKYEKIWVDVFGRDKANGALVENGEPIMMQPISVASPVEYTPGPENSIHAYDPETGERWSAVPPKGLEDMTGMFFTGATLLVPSRAILPTQLAAKPQIISISEHALRQRRHGDSVPVAMRNTVGEAVRNDVAGVRLTPGQSAQRTIVVDGQTFTYRARGLQDDRVSVGMIVPGVPKRDITLPRRNSGGGG